MKKVALLLLSALVSPTALSFQLPEFLEHPVQETDVKIAYMNIYAGPGRGFPIFYIAEKGEKVEIIRAHTEWFEVKTQRGVTGWAFKDELLPALKRKDADFGYEEIKQEDYQTRTLEFGLAGGEIVGNSLFAARVAYRMNDFFSSEAALSNAAGDFSTSTIYAFQLLYHPFRFGQFEPHFILGAGQMATEPKAGLIGTKSSHSGMTTYGLGVDYYWADRFIIRADWQNN
ncbi:MAG TPA: SH3 domain-containing protein, partial [Pseudomonadales bacterium]|nr:SH3 domain-containing protein [Pseudomonadales bacterium]